MGHWVRLVSPHERLTQCFWRVHVRQRERERESREPCHHQFFIASRRLLCVSCGMLLLGHAQSNNPTSLFLCVASSPRSYIMARLSSLQSTLWLLGHPGTLLVLEIERWRPSPATTSTSSSSDAPSRSSTLLRSFFISSSTGSGRPRRRAG